MSQDGYKAGGGVAMGTATPGMTRGTPRAMRIDKRYVHQNAKAAIQDIFDAAIELITNPDDRYMWLEEHGQASNGRIEIEVERGRKGTPRILRGVKPILS